MTRWQAKKGKLKADMTGWQAEKGYVSLKERKVTLKERKILVEEGYGSLLKGSSDSLMDKIMAYLRFF